MFAGGFYDENAGCANSNDIRCWKWVNGNPMVLGTPTFDDLWRAGEPNSPGEKCLDVTRWGYPGRPDLLYSVKYWNDIGCGGRMNVVCELRCMY